jgi:ABC-type transport system involved in cytochrome bd biosynthesis fused ATPase/permease subunit
MVSEVMVDNFHYAVVYSCLLLGSLLVGISKFTLLAIPVGLILCACVALQVVFRQKLQRNNNQLQEATNAVFQSISDTIEGVKVLRTAEGTSWALENLNSAFKISRIADVANEKCKLWLTVRCNILGLVACWSHCLVSHWVQPGQANYKIRREGL